MNKINFQDVCNKYQDNNEFENIFSQTYNKIYLLIHPFYSGHFFDLSKSDYENYFNKLKKSVSDNSQNPDTLAIITLENDTSFLCNTQTYDYLYELYMILTESFKNRLYLRTELLWYYDESHKLPIKFSEAKNSVLVTARWVYSERCVKRNLSGFSKAHKIPKTNCFINLDESVNANNGGIKFPKDKALLNLEEIYKLTGNQWWKKFKINLF